MKSLSADDLIFDFSHYLKETEHAAGTRQAYCREARALLRHLDGRPPCEKSQIIAYKEALARRFAPSTVNTKLAAVNAFLQYLEKPTLHVHSLRIQHKPYRDPAQELTCEEYLRLISAAQETKDDRLLPILVTLCSSGIRVSELPFITREAVLAGQITIRNKGKYRSILLPRRLCTFLLHWCDAHKLAGGPLFTGRTGSPLDRTSVWKKLKSLSLEAGVPPEKVYPHNLRRLFATCFYAKEKDLVLLADILGHSSINTTRLYVLSSGSEHRRKMDSLGLVP